MSAAAELYPQGGDGQALVLVHGYGADRYSWAAIAPALTDVASVYAVDLPGHGAASDDVGLGDPATLAEALARGLEGLPGPMVLVGHSLGGAVALHLAARAPARIRRLVLIAPAGLGADAPDRDFLSAFPELDTEAAARALMERLVVAKRLIVPAMIQHVLATLDRPGRRDALRKIAAGLVAAEPPPIPAGIPIDLVWGEGDAINPPGADGPGFAPASFLTLPGVGHLPHIEAAAKVNRVIRAGLEVAA